jgi:uncharacterized protein
MWLNTTRTGLQISSSKTSRLRDGIVYFHGMTNQTPAKDLIRYDLLVQEALKGVVRKVIADAGRDGLPGEHHFYISFRTDFPGVRLSQRMRDKYPEEMTIVLQHQFWDMGITEHAFEVGLSFSGIPERLLIPFDALVGFFDPSVQFGLKFELNGDAAVSATPATGAADDRQPPALKLAGKAPGSPAPAPLALTASDEAKTPEVNMPAKAPRQKAAPEPDGDAGASEDDKQSAQVLSLDAFRKKP